jgi:hypothetical protein
MYIVHRQYKVSKVFVDSYAFSPLLKGLSHEIDMAFEDMPAVLGQKKEKRYSNDLITHTKINGYLYQQRVSPSEE